MSLRVAIQMDPMESINFDLDSSLMLGLEAQRRGYSIYHYLPQSLTCEDNTVYAETTALTLRYERDNYYQYGQKQIRDLSTMDVILVRQDPPVDMSYISSLYFLDLIKDNVLIVNDPAGILSSPEKLLVTRFADLVPPTLISADKAQIRNFYEENKDIVLKPLFGYSGYNVFRIGEDGRNLNATLDLLLSHEKQPLIAQKFLKAVLDGDKRINVLNGKPIGAVRRKPAPKEIRANLHAGGTIEKTRISEREKDICNRVGSELAKRGILFAGLDFIGDYLIEINVTSPSAIQEINQLDDIAQEAFIWDEIENKLKNG